MTAILKVATACGAFMLAVQASALEVKTAVLRIDQEGPVDLPISRLDLPPEDSGFAGAALGLEDNQTTGGFLGQEYVLETRSATPDAAVEALGTLIADGYDKIVTLAPQEVLLELSDAAGDAALLLNAEAPDDELRSAACRANILHVAPSRAMLADALMQYLVWKQWKRVVLVEGSHPEDRALADAYRAAAEKFQARIVAETVFEDTGGARRTDTGIAMVQRQIPTFTQDFPDHDILVAADENEVFAGFLPYRTWRARPVAGSAGLRPTNWHPAHEAWAGMQFQTRFEELTNRRSRDEDYNAWLALRVIGEAVTRTGAADHDSIRDYALSDEFDLGGFKGQGLSFRPWNGQLRQPILLSDANLTISVSPQDGFLHQRSPLDTLGLDEPESGCTAFEGN